MVGLLKRVSCGRGIQLEVLVCEARRCWRWLVGQASKDVQVFHLSRVSPTEQVLDGHQALKSLYFVMRFNDGYWGNPPTK